MRRNLTLLEKLFFPNRLFGYILLIIIKYLVVLILFTIGESYRIKSFMNDFIV